MYVALIELPSVLTFGHITASHVACVLPLPKEQREQMLHSAEVDQWSVRELRRKVVSSRRTDGERRGRPSLEIEARAFTALRRHLLHAEQALEQMGATFEGDREQFATLVTRVARLSDKLNQMRHGAPEVTRVRHSHVEELGREQSA